MAKKTRSPSRRSPSKRSPSKRSLSKRSPSKRTPSKRSPSKRTPSRRSPSKRSPKFRSSTEEIGGGRDGGGEAVFEKDQAVMYCKDATVIQLDDRKYRIQLDNGRKIDTEGRYLRVRVKYCKNARIIAIDQTTRPPSYTIKLEDDEGEIQTEGKFLTPITSEGTSYSVTGDRQKYSLKNQ